MAVVTRYIRSAYPRADIAAVIPAGVRVSIVYTDKAAGDYIREAVGDEAAVEQFRAAIDGVYVDRPAPIIGPVEFMMLFPAAARVALRASIDPVTVDFVRLLDDPRLTSIDRNKPSVQAAIDTVAAAVGLSAEEIQTIKFGG
jgi:hypothetical protein